MKREQLITIAERVISRHQTDTPRNQAEAIADALEIVLIAGGGQPMSDVGCVDLADIAPPPAKAAALPISPSVDSSQERLVIMPGEEKAAPKPTNRTPIPRLTPPQGGAVEVRRQAEKQYWDPVQLSDLIHQYAPEKLTIEVEHPEKGAMRVPLVRNVVIGHGFDTVMLTYKHPEAPDEMSAFHNFLTTEESVDIDGALRDIEAKAKMIYRVRDSHTLPNRNPYDPNAPLLFEPNKSIYGGEMRGGE